MKKIFYSLLLVAATLGLASCEDVPAPFELMNNGSSTIVEPQGDGTLENPYNIAGINKVAKALATGETSAQAYYFKGKVVSFKAGEEPGNSYGNATFYISDDGTSAKQFYCYRVLGPDNKNFTSSDQLKEGDEVIMYGKVTNYNGTLETVQKEAYVYAINANGGEGGAPGTTDAIEATCAEAATACNALADGATSTETYCVTGYITDVYTTISKGQQSFWMDDTKDGGKVLQAYWANLPEGVAAFTKGSKVKITGNLLKYVKDGNVTVEIKNANVEILETGEGGDNTPSGNAIAVSCSEAVVACNALADGATSTEIYSITGYITEVIGNVSRNQQSFWMADVKDGQNTFEAYWANLPEGVAAFTKGAKVTITGNLVKYVKEGAVTPEIKNAIVEILEAGDNSGDNSGDKPGDNPGSITNATSTTIVMKDAFSSITTNAVVNTKTADGITMTFDANGGSTSPSYYANSNDAFCAVRLYAKNKVTISTQKTISKIVITCPTPSSTAKYNGNEGLTTSNGTLSKDSDTTITIDNINSSSCTITNDHTEAKGGTQLRIHTLQVIYAD